jgi:hypothetical protein
MFGLQDIEINVIEKNPTDQQVSANVRALLNEIATLLQDFIDNGNTSSIDLHSLPLLPGEYDAIKTILGEGEVQAHVETLGTTIIYETVVSGVWWVAHTNESDERIAEHIEITTIPEILKSQHADVIAAHTALQDQLTDWPK